MSVTAHVAMWSGPRNLSTALMRSFEARGDCRVSDEPLYAHYLANTGIDHPMRDAVIASQPTDWRTVVAGLVSEGEHLVSFQKHMAHHLLPQVGRDWLAQVRNALLIRHPRRVLASYARSRAHVEPGDLGLLQQVELLDHLASRGLPVVIVDATDLRARPEVVLPKLCAALGIPFTERMLAWEPGARASDGVWGDHWYAGVRASTGFAPATAGLPEVPDVYRPVLDALLPAWERLSAHGGRIRAGLAQHGQTGS